MNYVLLYDSQSHYSLPLSSPKNPPNSFFTVVCNNVICKKCHNALMGYWKFEGSAWSSVRYWEKVYNGSERPLEDQYHIESNELYRISRCPICGSNDPRFDWSSVRRRRYKRDWLPVLSLPGFLLDNTDPYSLQVNDVIETKYAPMRVKSIEKNDDFSLDIDIYKHAYDSPSKDQVIADYFLELFFDFAFFKQNEALDNVEKLINKYSCEVTASSHAVVNIDNFKLSDYLLQILTIEQNILSLSKRLEDLYFLRDMINCEIISDETFNLYKQKEALKEKPWTKIKLKDFPLPTIQMKKPTAPKKPAEPVLSKANFFNKKRVEAENAALIEKYEKEVEQYNAKYEKYQHALSEYNAAMNDAKKQQKASYDAAVKKAKQEHEAACKNLDVSADSKLKNAYELLKAETAQVEDMLKKAYSVRSELYSCGIIYEKYRDVVAVATFYEYLSSGRCDSLSGANGAYNIYENEIRMDRIVSKLDDVLESLEQIKDNQYKIWSTVNKTNKEISSLRHSTAMYMKQIAINTAATAYYAKKNAELTNALGFLVALK